MRARGYRKVNIEKFAKDERAKTFAIPRSRFTSLPCSGVRCVCSPFPFVLRGFSILNYHSLLCRKFSRIHSHSLAFALLCMALHVMRKFNPKYAAIAIIHSPSVYGQGLTLLVLYFSARNSLRCAMHGASTLHHHRVNSLKLCSKWTNMVEGYGVWNSIPHTSPRSEEGRILIQSFSNNNEFHAIFPHHVLDECELYVESFLFT